MCRESTNGFVFIFCRQGTRAVDSVPLLSPLSPFMLCAQSQPQQPSVTMMMLMLQPSPLVSLIVGARDHASSSADDVGCSADAYRSAAMLLLLQARLDSDCATTGCQSPVAFPPAQLHRKLALITTMRRMWLLEHAIGVQPPPPPAAFNAGPEREFEFLAARLGLSCDAAAACAHAPAMRALVAAVFDAGARTRLQQQLELPLQPALHTPPECFSDLLVSCVNAPCSCRTVHRAAALCL